jgi:hypothetical protein
MEVESNVFPRGQCRSASLGIRQIEKAKENGTAMQVIMILFVDSVLGESCVRFTGSENNLCAQIR